ncbi:LytR/AlgR family response regulator transcription factor [Ekhidna sp. To15]|uniref:LytR/AlgR family response regulator transcription factor n=1 Tax=Ekhidna sp. To15 TaxID=3395267 RepID=UPI003F51D6E1
MKLSNSFSILSSKEKKVHTIVWFVGLIMINIPDWRVTMGPFHSDDFSLLIPSLYGLVLNALLFYECSTEFQQADLMNIWNRAKNTLIIFFKFSLIEAALDSGYFALHYWTISKEVIVEIVWGQILMNFIFFYLPAVMFGFIKAWQKSESHEKQEPKIVIKDGAQSIHLSPSELTHVESDGNYVIYHAKKKHMIRQSLSQAEDSLPDYFVRSHKSFIINTRMIEKQTYNDLVVGGFIIPIGRKYRKGLQAILDS